MYVLSLAVLDDLDFKCLLIGERKDADRYLGQLRDLSGAKAPGSRHNLESVALGSNCDRLDEAMSRKALGKLSQFG